MLVFQLTTVFCFFFLFPAADPPKLQAVLSESQPWASSLRSERTASSPGSLRWPHRKRGKTDSESGCLFSHLRLPLVQCFRKDAALHSKEDFNNKVKTACQEKRTGTVGWGQEALLRWGGGGDLRHCIDYSVPAFSSFVRFKISKVIVVGDLAVGKTCLINR